MKRAIEMRKQVSAARCLPAESLTKLVRIYGQEDQTLAPHEVGGQSPGHLVGCREMDEPVAEIVGGLLEASIGFRLSESNLVADVVDRLAHAWATLARGLRYRQATPGMQ